MSSQDMTITYKAICDRALEDARERMPEWPKANTIDAWEGFMHDLEDLDAHEIAHECSDWDWVIYYARALELCQAVPPSVLHEAESQWHDMCGPDTIDDSFGLYEMACQLAAIIVTDEIVQAVETVREELLELAHAQLDNL
jgi:hypothetical protein